MYHPTSNYHAQMLSINVLKPRWSNATSDQLTHQPLQSDKVVLQDNLYHLCHLDAPLWSEVVLLEWLAIVLMKNLYIHVSCFEESRVLMVLDGIFVVLFNVLEDPCSSWSLLKSTGLCKFNSEQFNMKVIKDVLHYAIKEVEACGPYMFLV